MTDLLNFSSQSVNSIPSLSAEFPSFPAENILDGGCRENLNCHEPRQSVSSSNRLREHTEQPWAPSFLKI